jgi:hypothetical protein
MGISLGRRYALGHPLALNSFGHWIRLLRWGGGVDPKYYGRALMVTCFSPLSAIARLHERIAFGKVIDAVRIQKDPVFIIGHWRSGTTHLHNLLCHDPQFGFVTTFQSQAPKAFLVGQGIIRPIMAALMPRTRPMDNMPLGADLPQEEEFCLSNSSMQSFYLYIFFPRCKDKSLFRKYILFDGVGEGEFETWKREYLELVKKATFHMGGKQLVLKNPCNTARMEAVLRVFPAAKFIHIYRNPYVVYKSSLRLGEKLVAMLTFQDLDPKEVEREALQYYADIMRRFFEVKERIPKGRLAEIRYEDLEERPLAELERIYAELDLAGWDAAQGPIARYLDTLQDYEKNQYQIDEADRAKVDEHWGFAIKKLGYGGL